MVALPPGAALLLVSRGLAEARHKRNEFGFNQVRASLLRREEQSADDICKGLLDDVQHFMGKRSLENDVTVLALVRAKRTAAAAR
jgi:serine phosphatase RsbU (regulator of sigma subunit)